MRFLQKQQVQENALSLVCLLFQHHRRCDAILSDLDDDPNFDDEGLNSGENKYVANMKTRCASCKLFVDVD